MSEDNFNLDDITELPFGFQGKVFRSPMPFSRFDPERKMLWEYHKRNISVIVLLIEDRECLEIAGKDLRSEYLTHGFEVIYLPIPDFDLPELSKLDDSIQTALERIQEGKNLVVHCHAGNGRTGLFLACLAERALGYPGEEAILWLRKFIPGALETNGQIQMALNFSPKGDEHADHER